jgi:predicted Zn finger-like uncharacterized protein
MYTQCPECLTIYKIAADLIGQGRGSARCGHCAATFDVLRSLADSLPLESFDMLPLHNIESVPPQLIVPALRPGGSQQALLFDPDERMRRPAQPRTSTPAFARGNGTAYRSARNWPWVLGAATPLVRQRVRKARLPVAPAPRSGATDIVVARHPPALVGCQCPDHLGKPAQRCNFRADISGRGHHPFRPR